MMMLLSSSCDVVCCDVSHRSDRNEQDATVQQVHLVASMRNVARCSVAPAQTERLQGNERLISARTAPASRPEAASDIVTDDV